MQPGSYFALLTRFALEMDTWGNAWELLSLQSHNKSGIRIDPRIWRINVLRVVPQVSQDVNLNQRGRHKLSLDRSPFPKLQECPRIDLLRGCEPGAHHRCQRCKFS